MQGEPVTPEFPLQGDDKRYFDRSGHFLFIASGAAVFASIWLAYSTFSMPDSLLYLAWPPNAGFADSAVNVDEKLRVVLETNSIFSICLAGWLLATMALRIGSKTCAITNMKLTLVFACMPLLSLALPFLAGYTDKYSMGVFIEASGFIHCREKHIARLRLLPRRLFFTLLSNLLSAEGPSPLSSTGLGRDRQRLDKCRTRAS